MTSAELVPVDPTTVVDLMTPATDSWTAVFGSVIELARGIANTEFVPTGLRGSIEKTTAAILTGRELGLPPMAALASIHVISGKPGISAELMRALIVRDGHEFVVDEMTETRCVVRGRRKGDSDWSKAAYTMAEAQRAGDAAKNPNYKTRPAEMMLARATTRLARMAFADSIHGLQAIEEIDAGDIEDVPVRAPAPAQVKVGRQTRPALVRELPAPAAAVEPERPADPAPAEPTHPEPEAVSEAHSPAQDARAPAEQPVMPIGAGQRARIQMGFQRLGIDDRAERIYWTSLLAGRDVESTNDLTRLEARKMIDQLERCRDRDALEALGKDTDEGVPDGADQ